MMLRVGKVVQSHFTADRRRASNRMPLREWKISGKCLMPLKQTQREWEWRQLVIETEVEREGESWVDNKYALDSDWTALESFALSAIN